MSSVSIVAKKVTYKGIVNRAYLEIMFFLIIIQTVCPSLLGYADSVASAGIGLMNIDQ